jgi:hypothetical protein
MSCSKRDMEWELILSCSSWHRVTSITSILRRAANRHQVAVISQQRGWGWSVQTSWGYPSDHRTLMCWAGGEAASTTELSHFRPPLGAKKSGCLGKPPWLRENWWPQTNTVSKTFTAILCLVLGGLVDLQPDKLTLTDDHYTLLFICDVFQ